MSQMDLLVTNVAELLTAAVQEVLQLMGQAMLEYQKESARTRLENQSLQQKLKELQERTTRASDEVLKVPFPRDDEPHSGEDHVKEELVLRGDSVVSEQILNDNPVHIKLVLDDIAIDNQHNFLQGTSDYSLMNQRPLSMVTCSPLRRIPNPSHGSRDTSVSSNTDTSLGSHTIKVESKSELLECSVMEETDHMTTQAPVVRMQDAPLANEHNQQPVSTFSNIVHYSKPCKLLNSTSENILKSRVENTVHMGDVHRTPSMSESREILHSCHVCGKTFATPSSLGAHFVCHSNERPFVCKCCKFRFSRLADLKKHERIHTGERPYNCSLCGRRFNRTENLRRHLRKVHYGAAL